MSLGDVIVLYVISAFALHWIIRTAISSGMRDFEHWKRKQDTGPGGQG